MTCYKPRTVWRRKDAYCDLYSKKASGILFQPPVNYWDFNSLKIPCGQCVGCRLERSRQWAMRCVHEASLHERNCFITLTYSDEWLPYDWSLDVSVFQRFMKRFRNRYGSGIRFFHCGEYGDQHGRPHYHALIFGFDFPDRQLYKVERNGTKYYTSNKLQELWSDPDTGLPLGFAVIGDVTFESAGYVARYCMKKVNGSAADKHYQFSDPNTGEVFRRKPEYTTMSRRPGIGKKWFDKFHKDVYPRDKVVFNGKQMRPPKYYDRCYEFMSRGDPVVFSKLAHMLSRRQLKAKLYLDDNTPERLTVRERVALARLNQLKRGVDNVS